MNDKRFGRYIGAGITAFLVIGAALCLFFLLYHFGDVKMFLGRINFILRPIYFGLILAFLLLPVHRRILAALKRMTPPPRLKDGRNLGVLNAIAIVGSLLFALLVVYLLLAMLLPQLYLSVLGFVKELPGYIINVQNWLLRFWEDNPEIQQVVLTYYNQFAASVEDWLRSDLLPNLESINSAITWLRQTILPNLTGVVTNVYAGLLFLLLLMKDVFIGVIMSVYLLARKDTLAAQSKKIAYSLLPTRYADFMVEEVRSAYRILSGFINGKLVDSLIIGVICLVCCDLMNFPYPVLLATIVGVTNIIPFFGPFIGAIPCAVLILLVSPVQCIYFLIFILLLQQFDGNILGPKILGDSTGLSSFWVLFSILLFGGVFGFAGMVLGVPVFAMFYSIISRMVRYGLKRRGLPQDTLEYLGATGQLARPADPKGAGPAE